MPEKTPRWVVGNPAENKAAWEKREASTVDYRAQKKAYALESEEFIRTSETKKLSINYCLLSVWPWVMRISKTPSGPETLKYFILNNVVFQTPQYVTECILERLRRC